LNLNQKKMEKSLIKKAKQPQESKEFNKWAKKFKVSSLWTEDTPEKKEFIKRLQEARFAQQTIK
jgi:hypothetical protein